MSSYDHKIIIPGVPTPQGRPRTRIVANKVHVEELVRNMKARIAAIGTPEEPEGWEEEIQQMDMVLAQSKLNSFATIYERKEDKQAKEIVSAAARTVAPEELPTGPLKVGIVFFMPRPKGHYGTGRNEGKLKDWAVDMPHVSKPDIDNLVKLTIDALTGIFWKDDSQICEAIILKKYSDNPRTEVFIKVL